MKKYLIFLLTFIAIASHVSTGYFSKDNNDIIETNEIVDLEKKQRLNDDTNLSANFSVENSYNRQKSMSMEEIEYGDLGNFDLKPEQEVDPCSFVLPGGGGVITFNEHEPIDGNIENATEVNSYAKLVGTLDIKDEETQTQNNIGELDEDYYRFKVTKQKYFVFEYTGPENYYIEILRYGNPVESICKTMGTFNIELVPATYYIHIFTDNKSSITDDQYEIYFNSIRESNTVSLTLSSGYKSYYKMAVWENEMYPLNIYRYGESTATMGYKTTSLFNHEQTYGYVDPIFLIDEDNMTLTNATFLDSIIYIWDTETLEELSNILSSLEAKIEYAIYEREVNEIRAEYKEEVVDGVSSLVLNIIGFIPGASEVISILNLVIDSADLTSNIILSMVADIDYDKAVEDFEVGKWFGSLATACKACQELNGVLRLPKYYSFNEENSTSVIPYYKTKKWQRISSYIDPDIASAKDYNFILSGNVIDPIQYRDTKDYCGKITAFLSSEEFNNYIETNVGGFSLEKHGVHEYTEFVSCDNEYHYAVCGCGLQKKEQHSYVWDGEKYICEYCYAVMIMEKDNILSSKYYFDDEYNSETMEQNIISENLEVIKTTRLRCGYIDGYLTMSAKSNDADKAFVEYYLPHKLAQITYDFGLWSDDESLIRKSSIRFEVLINNKWITQRTFNAKEMSTNKDELISYTDILEVPADAFRFIVETNKVNNDNNRGRVVIGNIEMTQVAS